MKATDQIKRAALNKAIDYLLENPERNVAKIMDMIDKVAPDDVFPTQRAAFHQAIDDESNWYQLIMKILTDMNPQVRDRLIKTFIVDANMLAWPKQEAMRDQYHCNIPWAILLDPTSACNLRCTGCWAAEYGHKQNLTYEEIDSIINQGVKLGTHVYIYTGGEPLVRKHDLINLCEAHPDCAFLSFTNATLIDEEFVQDMIRVANFVPAISVEGFEEATDARRGEGTYAKVSRAMELLRENGLPFGVSCCYTSANASSIASEEFFDWLIEKGALFAWVFTYMPVGVGSPTSLMVHADQREHLYRFIREMREKKPLFTLDFQNDGEFVGGCIAGGRRYLHINAAGDVEPCVFAHYANVNIRETSLLDALRSPLFMQYYEGQPFNDNLLKPCPILENEGLLADMVKRAGAHSTDLQEKESAEDLCAKCHDSIAEWTPVAERIWNDEGDPLYDKRKNDLTQGMADTDMRKLAEQGRRELPESLMTKRERREHRKQRESTANIA
ncbi:radical SAM protein [Ellagibacter isourolithinifaciens]|uniref:Radical SAM protein n=1 Tax=Ellagibacter isourolithinifaciens TaxID=2137581 RepID=A0A6N6NR22_9ACTN|nr:radical SAM protein [Ellagibacter isourolithinifaciens]KAB1640364.1 radical SAM protein [Ellagibacter isourolithinifaciens]